MKKVKALLRTITCQIHDAHIYLNYLNEIQRISAEENIYYKMRYIIDILTIKNMKQEYIINQLLQIKSELEESKWYKEVIKFKALDELKSCKEKSELAYEKDNCKTA